MSEPLLKVSSIARSYSSTWKVLQDVSFELFPQQTCLLLGPNGAGKSTLLKIIAGLLRADSGSIKRALKGGVIGYASHESLLYGGLTVEENLKLFAALSSTSAALEKEFQRWDLTSILKKKASELSKGEQTRAGLARAFLGAPKLLLLDEPSANLDDASAALLSNNIKEFMVYEGKESAVLMASHDVSRLSAVCNSGLLLLHGAIVHSARGETPEVFSVVERYRTLNR